MALPQLDESQIQEIAGQVAEYIEAQRKAFSPSASHLDAGQRTALQSFFPEWILDTTKLVVLSGKRVGNPPFYVSLVEMGFDPAILPDFSQMDAITFIDTVVSHVPFDNSLLFHELVHAVQYEKLGLDRFADKYVRGFLSSGSYMGIPLEQNAYETQGRFDAEPSNAFSVEDEVQEWIDFGFF